MRPSSSPSHPSRADDAPASEQLQLVQFSVGDDRYGIDILQVLEISRMIALTRVPNSDAGIRCVINLRGRIIPVLDLHPLLGATPSPTTEQARIIIAESGSLTFGLVVDAVHEVIRVNREAIEPTPGTTSGTESDRFLGVAKLDEDLLILLSPDGLARSAGLGEPTDTHTTAA